MKAAAKVWCNFLESGTDTVKGNVHNDSSMIGSGVRRKFLWGEEIFSDLWWSFVFGVRCLWRHNLIS